MVRVFFIALPPLLLLELFCFDLFLKFTELLIFILTLLRRWWRDLTHLWRRAVLTKLSGKTVMLFLQIDYFGFVALAAGDSEGGTDNDEGECTTHVYGS
jgi:hypothetical protein